jgi:hypothetical protein
MSIASAERTCGLAQRAGMSVLSIGEDRARAGSTVTGRRAKPMNSGEQLTLALTMGWSDGPLFIVQKRRAPVIHGGTLGGKRRRRREARATPPWADRVSIRAMYREAKRLTKLTGELHVVDHIVPLYGKIVCGLHVAHNVRIAHWRENSKKAWHTWPGMPFKQQELL